MTDRVLPETRAAVLRRDGQCLLYVIDASHLCRDQWGERCCGSLTP